MISEPILSFLFNLEYQLTLPPDIQVMNPFASEETRMVCRQFYQQFYNDDRKRIFIVGINPGRFGGGITGIPFTDPIRLQNDCNIDNPWPPRQELSSVFIYEVIRAFGGVERFYRQFYFTSVSPLGFTANGKNLNYYDNRALLQSIEPFAAECMIKQLMWGQPAIAFCLGEGANFSFFKKFNQEYGFFKQIIPLPHPRFIMQYKLKQKADYTNIYIEALRNVGNG